MTIRRAAVAGAVALALSVAGCGGGDDRAGTRSSGVRTVAAAEALAAADDGGTVVIDVRTPQEYAAGHLAGARNVPLAADFEAVVAELPRDGRYVLYCQSGNRSGQAAQVMKRLEFADVLDAGGLSGLAEAGGQVVTG